LPTLPRGIFIEGWRPADPAPLASADDFLQAVVVDLSPHRVPPASIVADVFAVLAGHMEPRDAKAEGNARPTSRAAQAAMAVKRG
jgi:uncharacterized protein (DUF2267 family)